jgi:hypothetical protein
MLGPAQVKLDSLATGPSPHLVLLRCLLDVRLVNYVAAEE